MARIAEEDLERVKREVPVDGLVRARGVALKCHGKDLVGLCPFYDDREPSLVVTPSNNLWHCLGACQAGGSVMDWVMRAEGVSFRNAVELLRQAGPVTEATPAEAPAPPSLELPQLASTEADDQALLRRVVSFYHRTLKASPEALGCLRSRGLTYPELIDHFQLGFANRTLGYGLPTKGAEAGELRG